MIGLRSWLLILAVALAVRLAGGIWWQLRLPAEQWFAMPDSGSYWALGRALAAGEPYQFGRDGKVFRTPGFPLLLAATIRLGGDTKTAVWSMRVIGAVLGTVSVALVMLWARTLAGPPAAALAGGITAVYPGAIAMSILILSEMLFCPLMLAHLLAWFHALRSPHRSRAIGWAIAAGLLSGAASLTRPSWLLFAPFAGLIGIALGPDRRRQLALLALVLASLAVAMSPWWYRNYQVTGRFVMTTLQVGASLYDGWRPGATGASDMQFVAPFERALRAEQQAGRLPEAVPFEVALDQRMREASLAWARTHPGEVLRLMGVKFVRMWNLWPNAEELQNGLVRWGIALAYAPLLVLVMLGVWHYGRAGWLAWTPAVYLTLLHMIFVSSLRYREPAMLSLTVLGAAWLSQQWPRLPRASRASPRTR